MNLLLKTRLALPPLKDSGLTASAKRVPSLSATMRMVLKARKPESPLASRIRSIDASSEYRMHLG